MTDKLGQAEEEPYNGWILRNVYFEDGDPADIEELEEWPKDPRDMCGNE